MPPDLVGNTVAVWSVFAFYGCIWGLLNWIAGRRTSDRRIQKKREDDSEQRP